MENSDIKDLFKKFLQGQCTNEEKQIIIDYLHSARKEDSLPDIEEVIDPLLSDKMDDETAEAMFFKITNTHKSKRKFVPNISIAKEYIFKLAAVLIGFLVLSSITYYLFLNTGSIEYKTAYGEKQEIVLPDSSHVILNSNSAIRLAKNLGKNGKREIWLDGEAFFKVKKSNSIFVVHAQSLTVEVYGTQFNVKNRRNKTSVVLNSGKVKVKLDDKSLSTSLEMKPGDFIEYAEESKEVVQKIVDPSKYVAWQKNQMSFEKTPLSEIFQMLEDYYGLNVVVKNEEILLKKFTGSAPYDDMDILLDKLSRLFDIEINRNENIIEIK